MRKSDRLKFGRYVHVFIESLAKYDNRVIEKLFTDFDYFEQIIKENLYSDTTLPIEDEKILKSAWRFLRKKFKFNFINFIRNLKTHGYKILSEFPLYIIDHKTLKIKEIARPDIMLINKNKKKIICIEIKTAIRYESHKRQIRKYKKYLTKLFPSYKINFYLYKVKNDKLEKVIIDN